jgi:hypothetical protein
MVKTIGVGKIDGYGGRGVFVPPGMTAAEIMIGARVLTERWDVQHYEARSMVRDVLEAIRSAPSEEDGGNHVDYQENDSGKP